MTVHSGLCDREIFTQKMLSLRHCDGAAVHDIPLADSSGMPIAYSGNTNCVQVGIGSEPLEVLDEVQSGLVDLTCHFAIPPFGCRTSSRMLHEGSVPACITLALSVDELPLLRVYRLYNLTTWQPYCLRILCKLQLY